MCVVFGDKVSIPARDDRKIEVAGWLYCKQVPLMANQPEGYDISGPILKRVVGYDPWTEA